MAPLGNSGFIPALRFWGTWHGRSPSRFQGVRGLTNDSPHDWTQGCFTILCLNITLSLSLIISLSIYIYLYLSISIYIYLYLSISIYLYLSLSISIYLYLSLSISIHLYLSLSISIYINLSLSISIYLYLSLSISIYLYLSLSISICLYLSLSISIYLYLSLSISIYLSVYLSLCMYVYIYISILYVRMETDWYRYWYARTHALTFGMLPPRLNCVNCVLFFAVFWSPGSQVFLCFFFWTSLTMSYAMVFAISWVGLSYPPLYKRQVERCDFLATRRIHERYVPPWVATGTLAGDSKQFP